LSIFHVGFVFLEGDVLIEFGGAFVALGDEVEADTTNVLFLDKEKWPKGYISMNMNYSYH
jgi:hypothetical protein